ncbi:hypothetical protein SLA2020_359780 [Shorea laevis]
MNHCPQNSTGNLAPTTAAATTAASTAATAAAAAATAAAANSNRSGKPGRKDNDTHKRKRGLPQEAKEAKRMKEELVSTGKEIKQFNAALSNIQSNFIEIRMGLQLVLQKMARQEELIVDILDAIEEGNSVRVNDLVQILFST